jgi:nucleotide-binding universal stress UspA family protein
VVVGIDGSDAALRAAIWATDEAVSRNVPMRMVHVARSGQQSRARDDFRLEAQYGATALRVAAAVVEATGKQVKIETEVIWGSTATALINESEHASMICLGAVGIDATASKLLGSTAAMLTENACCPVTIVRAPSVASEEQFEPNVVDMQGKSETSVRTMANRCASTPSSSYVDPI